MKMGQIIFAAVLNLLVCLSAVIVGLVLYKRYRPPDFGNHRYTRWAFWFLLARWIALTAAYCTLIALPDSDKLMLGFIDLTSVCDMAFAWILVQGDDFAPQRTLYAFVGFCLFLWGWNLEFSPSSDNWGAPSNAFSAFTMPLVAFAFLLRLRGAASSILFLMALAYSVVQLRVSAALHRSTLVVGFESVSGYLLALAIGKIVVGSMIYGLFFAPVGDYGFATTELTTAARATVKKALKKAFKVGVNLLVALLAAIIVEKFWPVISRYLPKVG